MEATGFYACAVTALCNIAKWSGDFLIYNSISSSFTRLWYYTNTTYYDTTSHNEVAITLGQTPNSGIASGFISYLNDFSCTCLCSTDYYPIYQDFKDAVIAGKYATFSYGISINGNGGSTVRSGHTVAVIGYYKGANSNGNTCQFLKVANGWDTSPDYLNYEQTVFLDKYACFFTI
ncbi:MAG: hypothetical protein MJ194_06890 [Clostridia bacterium]|nr:hypothetical protein [Clostridia bacterium]